MSKKNRRNNPWQLRNPASEASAHSEPEASATISMGQPATGVPASHALTHSEPAASAAGVTQTSSLASGFSPEAPLDDDLDAALSFSDTRLAANRAAINKANAQLSTGPRTAEGKAVACLNSLKTGLTGRTVLLPSDDAVEYARHISDYEEALEPIGVLERDLVQSIADTIWRLLRIPGLEMALLSKGRADFADPAEDLDPGLLPAVEILTHLKYEKQIRNLQLQDARLFRRKEKEMAELRRLQQERKAKEKEVAEAAAASQPKPQQDEAASLSAPKTPAIGFEFSTSEMRETLAAAPTQSAAQNAPNQPAGAVETRSQAA